MCRDCRREYMAQWRKDNPEPSRERNRRGLRVQRPCGVCGKNQARFHPDFEPEWLCQVCFGKLRWPEKAERVAANADGFAKLAEKYRNR